MNNLIEIKGYEGFYLIGTNGDVFSVPRNGTQVTYLHKLKKSTEKSGYQSYLLQKKGKKKRIFIHRLVAINFIPNPENKPCVNHKNGIKSDNNLDNLEWCTISENEIHAHRTGLKNFKGDGATYKKVDSHKVRSIREQYSNGDSQNKLAAQYGICQSAISRIISKSNWASI